MSWGLKKNKFVSVLFRLFSDLDRTRTSNLYFGVRKELISLPHTSCFKKTTSLIIV